MTGWWRALRRCSDSIVLRWSQLGVGLAVLVRGRRCGGAMGRPRQQDRVRERRRDPSHRHAERHERIYRPARRAATLFESANEEITRSEFETFSGRLFETSSRRAAHRLAAAGQPQGARRIRGRRGRATACPAIASRRSTAATAFATAPQVDEYYPVFYSTAAEDVACLRHGLCDRSGAQARRSNARGTTIASPRLRTRLYAQNDAAPAARACSLRARLRQGNVARRGGRPAPQSGGLRGRHLRSAAADAVHSRANRGPAPRSA